MKRFVILRNSDKDRRGTFSKKVGDYLTEKGAECFYSVDATDIDEDVDCVIVLGGDGTLLRTAKKVLDYNIPLMGINLGTLGYLAEVDRRDVYSALDHLLDDSYVIEERMMLKGTVYHNGEVIASDYALNDVVILRQGRLRVVSFMNYINGEYLNSYNADGIILSTATGSTGYSLSCGGPIVSPEARIILLTPISPHTLITRSIIFQNTDRIAVEIGQGHDPGVAEANVSFDGDAYVTVSSGDRVVVEEADKSTKIVKISGVSFLEILRQKMAGS
jgi:NAD+ kinase